MSKTILIVDDDRGVQRLLADALAAEGFSVIVERDGEWALKTFESKPIDAVVLDLLIPALNGFQVAERIRATPRGRTVPLVLVSGIYKSLAHAAEAKKRYGVVDYLDKPLNLTRLIDGLRRAFGDDYPSPGDADKERDRIDRKAPERFAAPEAREEVSEVERSAGQFRGLQVTKGTLQKTTFAELVAELFRWRATGALLLQREKVKKIVYFKDGQPVFVKSNLLSECLGKLMVREKMITEAECEESLQRMKAAGRQQGTVLIEMGRISPHNLVYALELQLSTKLYDVFSWTDGEYQFNPKAEAPPSPVQLEKTAAQIIYEGVTRAYDPARLAQALGAVDELFVHPAEDPILRFQEAGLDDEELQLFQEVDGKKTVAQLRAKRLLSDERFSAFLYAMRCAQMLDIKAQRARNAVPPPPPVPKLRPPAAPPPLVGSRTRPPPPPPPEAAKRDAPLPAQDEREVRERLAAQVAAMKKLNHFEILGVPRDSTAADVKRAYFKLAKECHPDKHFASASAEVKRLAGEVFAMLQNASDVLQDDEERTKYVSELDGGGKKAKVLPGKKDVGDEVNRILAAEGKFQRGEELLRKKYFQEAIEAFKEAVSLYPDEGEFHAYLGWALFEATPNDDKVAQQALDTIEVAVRLNPKLDKSYLFAGFVYKATGRPDKAEKQFEKAIQCNPDCTEALRELRLSGNKPRGR